MSFNNNEIPAGNNTSPSDQTIALYCRSATKSNYAIDSQKNQLIRFANQNGYTSLSWYVDVGESGAILYRPAMNRLIEDIKSGEIGIVATVSADCIARGFNGLAEWVHLLEEYGARCFAADSRDHELA